jgi:hypothetical protein
MLNLARVLNVICAEIAVDTSVPLSVTCTRAEQKQVFRQDLLGHKPWEVFMKYAVEMGSGAMINIPHHISRRVVQ